MNTDLEIDQNDRDINVCIRARPLLNHELVNEFFDTTYA